MSWFSRVFGKQYKGDNERRRIEKYADKAGLSLEEFLKVHPELAKRYRQADMNIFDRTADNVKEAAQKVLSDPTVSAYLDNITGERDIRENAKNRQFQHDEAEIARVWQEEQAQAAREWDSIGAQMERAAAAGVNPVSIAMQNGGINSSATTSIPSSPGIPAGSASLMHSGLPDLAATVFQGIGTFAEQRLKQSQADDIVAMRQYNIAEKMANTDHLKQLCKGVELSNTAQEIQNAWLDKLNEVRYLNDMKELGVKDSTIFKNRTSAKLDLQQIESCKQEMRLALERFNATLPLELQLMSEQINNTAMSTQDIYEEICLRHLQAIEQESRNTQAAAEAEGAQLETGIKKATYEDAIHAFHNDMVKGAAEAGITYNDFIYYGVVSNNPTQAAGKAALQLGELNHRRKNFVKKLFTGKTTPYYEINGRATEKIQGLE